MPLSIAFPAERGMSCSKKQRRKRSRLRGAVTCEGKWIDVDPPDLPVGEVARRILSRRLQAVAHWLPLAAHRYLEDVEHVHQLRVSCRRAGARIFRKRDP